MGQPYSSLITQQHYDPDITASLREQNKKQAVSRLHSDVLLEIFQQYQIACSKKKKGRHRWIRVSHVCYYWRRVALESEGLWINVHVDSLGRTKAALLRSVQAPLNISSPEVLPLSTEDAADVIHSVAKKLHRVRRLQLSIPPPLVASFLALCETAEAPELISVDLNLEGSEFAPEDHALGALTARGAPNLRVFSFCSYECISWNNVSFPETLRSLSITQTNPHPFTMPGLYPALRRLPQLESLNLDGVLPQPPTFSAAEASPLTLEFLRSLSLASTAARCASFLEHVRLPNVKALSLKCEVLSDHALEQLAPALCDTLKESGMDTGMFGLDYDESHSPYETRLHLCSREDLATNRAEVLSVRLVLVRKQHAHSLSSFVDALPLGSVKRMFMRQFKGPRICSVLRWTEEESPWETSFRGLRSLQTLHLIGHENILLPFIYPQSAYTEDEQKLITEESGRMGGVGRSTIKIKLALRKLGAFFPALGHVLLEKDGKEMLLGRQTSANDRHNSFALVSWRCGRNRPMPVNFPLIEVQR